MAVVMTKEWLLKHCKERGLYQTPYLNDRLYLQCQAICDIQNLDEYTGVKLLYLEENCLETMDGLQPLKQLQCLYLRRNFIKTIAYLDGFQFLDTLDISQNYISCLENLSKCLSLRVLVVSHNQLESTESIIHLMSCPSIMILDLSHNKLKDGNGLLEIARGLPRLAVLYLTGNSCISRMPNYRKNVIGNLKNLTHLDDRPVFWDERLYAEAWLRGGQEAETAERDRVRQIRAEEEIKQFESMRRIREQSMEERLHVARPNYLHFDPAELGEEEPESCAPTARTPVDQPKGVENAEQNELSPTEKGVTAGCESSKVEHQTDLSCDSLMDGEKSLTDLQAQQPESSSSERTASIYSEVTLKEKSSEQQFQERLAHNPLFNNCANTQVQDEPKAWPKANPSMFSVEVQSICLPEWHGSDPQADSYCSIHNNTLFSENTARGGHSELEPPQSEPMQEDQEPQPSRRFSTVRESGRCALASLATLQTNANTDWSPFSTVKNEDNFLLTLQAMSE